MREKVRHASRRMPARKVDVQWLGPCRDIHLDPHTRQRSCGWIYCELTFLFLCSFDTPCLISTRTYAGGCRKLQINFLTAIRKAQSALLAEAGHCFACHQNFSLSGLSR